MSLTERIKKKMGVQLPSPKPVPMPKHPIPGKGRLPDGARFEARWDAKAKLWHGTITVDDFVAIAVHTSLTRVCYMLDDLYRAFTGPAKSPSGGD